MERFYFTEHLIDNASSEFRKDILDSLKFSIDRRIYHYGEQFKYPYEPSKMSKLIKSKIRDFVHSVGNKRLKTGDKGNVICSAFFGLSQELRKQGYFVYDSPWMLSKRLLGVVFYSNICKIKYALEFKSLDYLLSKEMENEILGFRKLLKEFLLDNKVKGCILPFDLPFFEREIIKVCKELKIPTAIFLHGLPAIYSKYIDNRTDYVFVWGEQIRQNRINCGTSAEKIMVSGKPNFKISGKKVKSGKKNVLVISKAMCGAQQGNGFVSFDRGKCLLYLKLVEDALKKCGIKSARLRPHPSENPKWYMVNLGENFYSIDSKPLARSVKSSDLVIGPASTVFLDSINWGVNYILFEPKKDGKDILDYEMVNPFDGSNPKIPVANTIEELIEFISKSIVPDTSFLSEYVSELNIKKIMKVLEN
jgi:hypothetical protein